MSSSKQKTTALTQAAQTLTQPTVVNTDAPIYTGSEGFNVGRYGLASDETIRNAGVTAVQNEGIAESSWQVLADLLFTKGIRSVMLKGKDAVAETVAEVRDFLGVIKYGNAIAGIAQDGTKVPAMNDIRAFWGDRKSASWQLIGKSRQEMAKNRAGNVTGIYMDRLFNALAVHEDPAKKGKKASITLEERYLNLLGPVLLFLQGIDLTKVDPKFDWNEEFTAVSTAVARAKKAKNLATVKKS